VFVSRLNFPAATLGVVFILAVAFFEKGVGGCSRCLAAGSFPGCGLFFVRGRILDGFFQAAQVRSPGGKPKD
jgi:hypothetical protein